MSKTGRQRLAMLTWTAVLAITACLSTGCEKRVISERSYSTSQFPQYSHLPRADPWSQPAEEEPGFLEGVGNGVKKLFKAIGKLNPLD